MAAEVMEQWVKNGRYAVVCQRRIKPIENTRLKGKPLSSQKGQAEAFFLKDERGHWLVLKKFHSGRSPDRAYLSKVGSLLPRDPGFTCGTDRHILSKADLVKTKGYHYNAELARWLDGTVMMPKASGYDWTTVADELRDGTTHLDTTQRFILCRNLTRLIELLEAAHCCHRDLSCGNVFIETVTGAVSLIDFGSFYHPSLPMPKVTTCGTEGYTAPYAWDNGTLNARRTWCESVDRYPLSLLIAEYLLVTRGTRITSEGGIFEQDELRKRSGRGINSILSELKQQYPKAAQLLQRTILSHNPKDCPSPREWNHFFDGAGVVSTLVILVDMPEPSAARISDILSRCRPAAPIWPAPPLSEIPLKIPQIPKGPGIAPRAVSLPPDPWEQKTSGRQTFFRRPSS